MSHKVHPKIFRVRETKDWVSRWVDKRRFAANLEQDFRIREFLQKKLKDALLDSIEIERFAGRLTVIISAGRPGLIIGRGGSGIELVKKALHKLVGVQDIRLEIREIKNQYESAALIAQNVAQQLEKRMPHRRVLKQTMQKIMANRNIQGARVEVAGRLGGADIARREGLKEGRLPLQTQRAKVDYSLMEAKTTYGTIGVKVWLYKGETFDD
ncbi:MAG: 30S ribosomal protein S3 [Candidatus Wildermuthbacteria bacterium RIFCSPHIGHO2_02_FULL_49_9]|uniref:Small ribosomal subunit protein uS3 n=1 Tax=Candidatus Wildermuthbacteria bacterium RIFCSPHIGHO2_02_FULL_49_9 TaxID=1802456 RepID=A0A1G2RCH4_9BACT|nr:MAG: 30S ribosomal protein S3 [Candidatus Wildermuthbacteria bacterium RIFCSPHIGHO2_02_FULL_49_9]